MRVGNGCNLAIDAGYRLYALPVPVAGERIKWLAKRGYGIMTPKLHQTNRHIPVQTLEQLIVLAGRFCYGVSLIKRVK